MLLRLLLLLALAGCPGPQRPPSCTVQGDAAQPVELLPIAADGSGNLHALHDGDTVLLQKPSQGGFVVYAGAAARNLDPCLVQLTAELIDPSTGNPLTGLDQRQADLVSQSGGYWWPASELGDLANIPSCPDALHVGVVGRPAILRVDVLDATGRGARVETRVTPVCPAGDATCACVCGPDPGGC
ncbi:MAG: hypothetical protein ACXWLM_03590 [Myxococcales bacterium]